MFAIEQVEVTKGSSSALTGGSGVGGSINMIPKVAHEGDEYQGTVAAVQITISIFNLTQTKTLVMVLRVVSWSMGHENEKPGQQ
jgi:catecholate siderophore receptor